MTQLAQEAVIAGLARRLRDQGSWSGETHLQKATYLLAELLQVPFDFDFILYKHGPFSFELRDELGSMRVDRLLEREPQVQPYGPRLLVTDEGQRLEERFPRTLRRYGEALDWVATVLGRRGVSELERLATALWVTRREPGASVAQRATSLMNIKPHVDREAAVQAVEEIDRLALEAPALAA
jgi:hypothetical protein